MTAQTPSAILNSHKRKLCPYISNPFSDCYCVNITSDKIPNAVMLCGGSYAICKVFLRNNGSVSA